MKSKLAYYFEKLLSFFMVKQIIAGVEVSDLFLRMSYLSGNAWRFGGVRLEPGVIDAGKVKNHEKAVAALKSLKAQIFGEKNPKEIVGAIVSLSSVNVYSQVFSLPLIEGENLNRAIELNIQMISPVDVSQAYSGWQMVGEDRGTLRLEILSAFIDRSVTDGLGRAFGDAGMSMVAIESMALALTRLVREESSGLDIAKPYVLMSMDNSGMDFLIMRRGQLYFEYFNPWRDIADEKGQILPVAFEAAIVRNLRQIINFYSQHWTEPLEGIIFVATALKDEVQKIINNNFSIPLKELKLRDLSAGTEWFVSLGCGLRGTKPRSQDREISLLGIGAEEAFHREQLIAFADFWKWLLSAAILSLFLFFLLADAFLIQTKRALESESSVFTTTAAKGKESAALEARAREFNRSVALISAVQAGYFSKSLFLDKFNNLAENGGVAILSLNLPSETSSPVNMSGRAASEEQIVAFKNALAANPMFTNVNLPLASIKAGPGGVTFTLSFNLNR